MNVLEISEDLDIHKFVKTFARVMGFYELKFTIVECPRRKDGRGKSCRLHPRENGLEVVQRPGGVITSPTLLVPILMESQQN